MSDEIQPERRAREGAARDEAAASETSMTRRSLLESAVVAGGGLALLGAAALGAGAAIFTAILVKARDSIADVAGAQLHLTNALWMMWAAFGALTLSIVPFIISCCTGRSEKY